MNEFYAWERLALRVIIWGNVITGALYAIEWAIVAIKAAP